MTARELLAQLVAHPTIAGTPNGELIAFAADRLQGAGAAVTASEGVRPDAQNLHAVLGPADADDGGVMLSAHTDVVAVEGQDWSRDPFAVHTEDGRLYGRGTADMKGFIAAVLAVLPEVDQRRLRRPVHVILSSDEEIGCRGVRPLLECLRGEIAPPAVCIVGEPTRMRVVQWHKGKLALRVEVRGHACHSSRASEGVNAVEFAARMIIGVVNLQAELREGPGDGRFSIPHTTLSTGPIHGGVAVNIVPDSCAFELEVRHLPGEDPAALQRRLADLAADLERQMRAHTPSTGIELTLTTSYPALDGVNGDPLADEVAAVAGTEAGGAVEFGTEAGLIAESLGLTVLVCGPGDMAQAHRPDEYLELEQLQAAETFIRRLLTDPRGVPASPGPRGYS